MKVKSKKTKVKNRLIKFALLMSLCVVFSVVKLNAQSGGTYQITQNVVATGARSSGGNYAVENTSGQPLAGGNLQNGSYSLYSGFWTPPNLIPTAANVSVCGRVTAANGIGIRNAVMSLTDSRSAIRTARTATFGFYCFENVSVGENYIINVSSKRFVFAAPTRILNVSEELSDIDFVAEN